GFVYPVPDSPARPPPVPLHHGVLHDWQLRPPPTMRVTRRSLMRGLLVALGVDPVALWRMRGRGDKAAAAPPPPLVAPSPTALLSASVLEDLLAFGELVVEGRTLSAVERRYLAEYIEDRAQQESGYYASLYRTTVEYLAKLAGARFSELDLDQRI